MVEEATLTDHGKFLRPCEKQPNTEAECKASENKHKYVSFSRAGDMRPLKGAALLVYLRLF